MNRLLNFSTHGGDLRLFADDWDRVAAFVAGQGFDGLELLPVGDYPFARIPAALVHGLHLRFFVMLRQIWRGDRKWLLETFGDWETVRRFYGGTDRTAIVDTYVHQLELARRFGCRYVVFHPVHCELDHVHDWRFPWSWRETLELCAEVMNEVLARSRYRGWLLFENLWWPGSLRLRDVEEYAYLRQRVAHDRCGIVLDTGHLLADGGGFDHEEAAISHLLARLDSLGELRREIRAVHLTCSLSGRYIRASRKSNLPRQSGFRQRLQAAREHVMQIDRHDPFSSPAIDRLFTRIEPADVVFEFSFRDLATWQEKIRVQKQALRERLWT